MKSYTNLLLIGLVLLACRVFGQATPLDSIMPVENGKVMYSATIQVEGITKDELFSRLTRWFATGSSTSKVYTGGVKLADKEAGSFIGQAFIDTPWAFNGWLKKSGCLEYTLIVDVKDGKYRYKLTDLVIYGLVYWRYQRRDNATIEEFTSHKNENHMDYTSFADLKIKEILTGLEKAMQTAKVDF